MNAVIQTSGLSIQNPVPPCFPDAIHPPTLFRQLREEAKKRLWIPSEEEYSLIPLFSLMTYLKNEYDNAAHLVFAGDTGSGKDNGLSLIAGMSYRTYFTMPTYAAFVNAQIGCPDVTLVLEEFQGANKGGTEDARGIAQILLSMVDRGRPVTKHLKEGDKWTLIEVHLFGPVCFSTKRVWEFPPELADRCFVISTRRAPIEEARDRFNHQGTDHIGRMLVWRVHLSKAADEMKKNPDLFLPDENLAKFGMDYRARDAFNFLLPAARYFGVVDELEKCIRKQVEEKIISARDSWTGKIVNAFLSLREDTGLRESGIALETLRERTIREYDLPDTLSKRDISRILQKNLGFRPEEKRKQSGGIREAHTYFSCSDEMADQLSTQYGYKRIVTFFSIQTTIFLHANSVSNGERLFVYGARRIED